MNELAEQKLVQHLYEAHATELMLVQTLTGHVAITPAGDYRDLLQRHLRQTRDHAQRIQKHLAKREQSRGALQVGYGLAQSAASQMFAMAKLPMDIVRGMSGEEKLLRNARDECANEAMEIATYLAIEELATAVGDTDTARLAASLRADEERMLENLLELIPRLASDVVRAEVEGTSRFDVRHIGAVDAARVVAGTAARRLARTANRAGRTAERSTSPDRRAPSPRTVAERDSAKSSRSSGTTARVSAKRTTTKRSTTTKRGSTTKRSTAKARS